MPVPKTEPPEAGQPRQDMAPMFVRLRANLEATEKETQDGKGAHQARKEMSCKRRWSSDSEDCARAAPVASDGLPASSNRSREDVVGPLKMPSRKAREPRPKRARQAKFSPNGAQRGDGTPIAQMEGGASATRHEGSGRRTTSKPKKLMHAEAASAKNALIDNAPAASDAPMVPGLQDAQNVQKTAKKEKPLKHARKRIRNSGVRGSTPVSASACNTPREAAVEHATPRKSAKRASTRASRRGTISRSMARECDDMSAVHEDVDATPERWSTPKSKKRGAAASATTWIPHPGNNPLPNTTAPRPDKIAGDTPKQQRHQKPKVLSTIERPVIHGESPLVAAAQKGNTGDTATDGSARVGDELMDVPNKKRTADADNLPLNIHEALNDACNTSMHWGGCDESFQHGEQVPDADDGQWGDPMDVDSGFASSLEGDAEGDKDCPERDRPAQLNPTSAPLDLKAERIQSLADEVRAWMIEREKMDIRCVDLHSPYHELTRDPIMLGYNWTHFRREKCPQNVAIQAELKIASAQFRKHPTIGMGDKILLSVCLWRMMANPNAIRAVGLVDPVCFDTQDRLRGESTQCLAERERIINTFLSFFQRGEQVFGVRKRVVTPTKFHVLSALEASFNGDEKQARIFYSLLFRERRELRTKARHLMRMTAKMGMDRCVLLRRCGKHIMPDIFEYQTLAAATRALTQMVLDLGDSAVFGARGPRDKVTFRTIGGCCEAEMCIRYHFGVDFVQTSHSDYQWAMEQVFPLVRDQFPKSIMGRPQLEIRYHDTLMALGELGAYYAVTVGSGELVPKDRYLPEGVPRNLYSLAFNKLQARYEILKKLHGDIRSCVLQRRKEGFVNFGQEVERRALHDRLMPKLPSGGKERRLALLKSQLFKQ
eukprot:GEMP01018030.1.p1 GENE.GEMP01018030.1~~GEMP01018030.1.p1  ORF type:complete len:893 (+),score=184.65 GEMP01018030.1:27-2681(+)